MSESTFNPTDAMDEVELAGPQWIDLVRSYLEAALPPMGAELEGVRFSVCEVFTAPPPHLATGEDEVAWHAIIDGTTVDVGPGRVPRADYFAKLSYGDALAFAKTLYGDQPGSSEAPVPLDPPTSIPPVLAPVFRALHDHLARRTA